mmetsp:Transcript_12759/g.21564  ORF Transcript_12759/g.21564 Transcript_12759/m.21564 type:complete len:301 (-) Transcript_12759:279-1181(-)
MSNFLHFSRLTGPAFVYSLLSTRPVDASLESQPTSYAARTFSVKGRIAIVTGSTQGLGRAMATSLYCSGATVVINGRDQKKTEAAATSIKRYAETLGLGASEMGRLIPIAGDVSVPENAIRVVEDTVKQCGGIDILINNAGVNANEEPAEDCTLDTWQWVHRVNVDGPFLLTKAALPHIKASKAGRVVMLSSMVGHVAAVQNYPYATSKGAVLQMMRTLAAELAETGVTVNAISPGVFDTEMNTKFSISDAAKQGITSMIPMKRFGQPPELAGVTLLLCSDAGAYITGQSLVVDGGYICQ